jgi:hypothetical protein
MGLPIFPAEYREIARQMLSSAPDRRDEERTNPVTGGRIVNGLDPLEQQVTAAARALMARDYFAKMAPPDVQPLSLSYYEREARKAGGLLHIEAWYSRSLNAVDYDFAAHPQFEPYVRGVLASSYAPDFIKQDVNLQQRFPPRPLKGLGHGLHWRWEPAGIRHARSGQQRLFLRAPPPPHCKDVHNLVNRQDANVPPSYAPNSRSFMQLDDNFIAHATKLAPYKRLPRGWELGRKRESASCVVDAFTLWVVAADYGWLIERQCFGGTTEVLAHILIEAPVLCDTYVTAARLAEAAHRGLPAAYQLKWISTK